MFLWADVEISESTHTLATATLALPTNLPHLLATYVSHVSREPDLILIKIAREVS